VATKDEWDSYRKEFCICPHCGKDEVTECECNDINVHENHIDNPEQYDKDGKFIVGSGEVCPCCGTEWEDHFAVAMCPCHDRDL
jgi:hypothetical protein